LRLNFAAKIFRIKFFHSSIRPIWWLSWFRLSFKSSPSSSILLLLSPWWKN
jgi:hypothetical protein